jgi:HEAT repeat protein
MASDTGTVVPLTFHVYQDGHLVRSETLHRDVVKIGSHSGSHLRLEDDDSVSRIHAVIDATKGPDQVELIDLDSTNGTIVNGKRINKCLLQTGHEVLIGNTKLVVEIGTPTDETAEDEAPTRVQGTDAPVSQSSPPPPPPPPVPVEDSLPSVLFDSDDVPEAPPEVLEDSRPAPSADADFARLDSVPREPPAPRPPSSDPRESAWDEGLEHTGGEALQSANHAIRHRPSRGWMFMLLILVACCAIGYLYWSQQHGVAEVESLATTAMDMGKAMPRPDRVAALCQVVAADRLFPTTRANAAKMLGTMGDAGAAPTLIAAVTDTGELSQAAAVSLGRLSEADLLGEAEISQARDRIFPQMQAATGAGKTSFAFALALLHDERCVSALLEGYVADQRTRNIPGLDARLIMEFATADQIIPLTSHADVAVRVFAAQALGEKVTDQGPDALISLLGDREKRVVQTAAGSLAKIAPMRAGPELIQLLKRQPELQSDLVVALRDAVGAPALQPIYEDTEDWDFKLRLIQHVRAPAPPGREVPADMPRGIGDPRGGDMCYHFYTNYPGKILSQQEMGLWCLEELGDERAAEGLYKVAVEPYSPERDAIVDDSIRSIGYLKLPGSQDFLLNLLKEGKGRPATILGALGRMGDPSLGDKIEPYTHCPETDVLSGGACDRETALKAIGRLHWPKALKLFMDIAERRSDDKVATRIESRDVWSEFRLRDRLAALEGLAHLGDPAAAELLMKTLEDTEDDMDIRVDSARALAYSANDQVITTILAKIRDSNLDTETRKYYVTALWHHPNREAVDDLLSFIADESTPQPLLITAGFAVGEAGEENVNQERLRELLRIESTERLIPACLAALMAGDDDTVRALARLFEANQALEGQVRDRYAGPDGHPVFLTPALFDSGRLYRRLHNADLLASENLNLHAWVWRQLVERLFVGTASAPSGMSHYEILSRLANDVRTNENGEWRRMAAEALVRMGYRGYVLVLAAEEGPGAEVARRVLISQ